MPPQLTTTRTGRILLHLACAVCHPAHWAFHLEQIFAQFDPPPNQIMPTFKQQLWRYWLAMNEAAIQSAAHVGKAWLATAGVHALSADTVPTLNVQQFLAVLLFAFGLAILDWLDKNPLPTIAPPK